MDAAVSLVQAYLYANGYFTVTEYPIIAPTAEGRFEARTDVDLLAVRFPGAGRFVPAPDGTSLEGGRVIEPDSMLQTSDDRTDLLIGEVKEGEAVLNRGTRDHGVLRVTLARFGAASEEVVDRVIRDLEATGEALVDDDTRIRLVAFGASKPGGHARRYLRITLGHVVAFLRNTVISCWPMASAAQFKDDVISLLMVFEKAHRAAEKAALQDGVKEDGADASG